MMKRRKAVVGAASVAAVLLAGGTGYAVVVDGAAEAGAHYCAEMPDAIGLYAGNPVTQMGFEVGTVDRIEPVGDHVKVHFTVAAARRFPTDVKAVTRSRSLLADRSLELVGNYESGPELYASQCIPLEHSLTPKNISEVAGSAADFIDALSPSDGEESFERAVAGMEAALRGQGESAAAMMGHAAAAMASPDGLVADLSASIADMAPLTDEALQRWATIRSILDQAPTVVAAAAYDLMPGVNHVVTGTGYLVKVLYDVQRNYGADIWPFMHGAVTDLIRLAAGRTSDFAQLLETIPLVADFLRGQASNSDGFTMSVDSPVVATGTHAVPLLDLVLAEVPR